MYTTAKQLYTVCKTAQLDMNEMNRSWLLPILQVHVNLVINIDQRGCREYRCMHPRWGYNTKQICSVCGLNTLLLYTTLYAFIKMHYNIPFSDDKTPTYSVKRLNPIPSSTPLITSNQWRHAYQHILAVKILACLRN